MPSAEGRGRARGVWERYLRVSNRLLGPTVETLFGSAIKSFSANTVTDLVGFWVLWHLHGGFEGLRDLGFSRSSIYRKTHLFRRLFGAHPDEYEFPGVKLDIDAYLSSTLTINDQESQKLD
ncbi:hypothetical protein GCM10008944_03770 [Cytobacillus oceanisediminis]